MRTPIRKIGQYAHLKPDPHLTEDKIKELKNKLGKMKKKHPFLAAEVKRLAADGDFSENAAYQIAKGRLRGLNQRIIDTENHLNSAIVIPQKKNLSVVQIGCTVEVEVNNKQKTLTILGSSETNPGGGVISHNSPIGSALLNKKIGDQIKIPLKNKIVVYTIKKIH